MEDSPLDRAVARGRVSVRARVFRVRSKGFHIAQCAVAATSATAPPIIASLTRMSASPGAGASALMMIDCTIAWITSS